MFVRLWLGYVFRPVNYSTKKLHQISCPFCRQRTLENVYGKLQLKSGRLEVCFSVWCLAQGMVNHVDAPKPHFSKIVPHVYTAL